MPKHLVADSMSKCIGCFTCMSICAGVNHNSLSMQKSSIKVKTSGGLSGKFKADVCQACIEPACSEVCPTGALKTRNGGGVSLKSEECIGCKRCVSNCIARAIKFDDAINKPIVCKQCGACVKFCPHNCLVMEER